MSEERKTVVITGGTKGFGLATAKRFAAEGAQLFLTFRRDADQARRACQYLESQGVRVSTIMIDLTETDASERLFTQISQLTNKVDVYVHNAAATVFKLLMKMNRHHYEKTFQVTVGSFIENVQRLIPLMPSGGSIVTVSGMDTHQVVPGHGLLGAAKAALEMLTRYFAHELAPLGIRVNGVNPGFVPTESLQVYFGNQLADAAAKVAGMMPSKRVGTPEEIASVIYFLTTEDARWITGQTVVVDGGQTVVCPPVRRETDEQRNA